MAKQNVTYVERHLEKLVIGLAGAVLLGVVVMYVVTTPHKAAPAGGQELGPSGFYNEMARQADAAQRRLSGATPSPLDNPIPQPGPQPGVEAPPLQMTALPFAPNPPLPEVKASGAGSFQQKVELVEMLPPTKPALTTGRSSGRFPDPLAIPISPGQPSAPARSELTPLTSDKQWVTLAATISREAQLTAFIEAGYLPGRLELVVTDVLVERQERLPNGQWGESRRVVPYMPARLVPERTVIDIVPDGAGYAISQADGEYLTTLRSTFEKTNEQDRILRPPFQEFIQEAPGPGSDPFAWKVPETLPMSDGSVMNLKARASELGIHFEGQKDAPSATGRESRGRAGQGPGTQGTQALEGGARGARDALRQAQQAIEKKDYLEAERLLQMIVDQPDTTGGLAKTTKAQADKLLREYQRDFEEAHQREELATVERPGLEQSVSKIGPNVEPLWANDTSVEPGKCYRYRLSLLAISPYAGVAASLKNPDDARKLLVEGRWSDWSDPIIVPPDKYLFATGVKPSSGTVTLELQQWVAGTWKKAAADFRVGDVVEFPQQRHGAPFSYGAVVLAVDGTRRALQPDRKGKAYQPAETGAVLLVDARGDLEEHLVAVDAQTRVAVKRMIQEQASRAKEKEKLDSQGQPSKGENRPTATPTAPTPRHRPAPSPRESVGS